MKVVLALAGEDKGLLSIRGIEDHRTLLHAEHGIGSDLTEDEFGLRTLDDRTIVR